MATKEPTRYKMVEPKTTFAAEAIPTKLRWDGFQKEFSVNLTRQNEFTYWVTRLKKYWFRRG